MPKALAIQIQTDLLARIAAGQSSEQIERELGVGQTTVSRYKLRLGNGAPSCRECGGEVADLPFAKTCKICRAKKRKAALERHHYLVSVYKPTEEIDNAIRKVRTEGAGSLSAIARKYRWSLHAVSRRAAQLGFARLKRGDRWSEAELQFLERNAHLAAVTIEKKMRSAGFKRSEASIKTQLARKHLPRGEDATASSVALAFGVEYTTVVRWINLGFLKARRRGGALAKHGRDWWIISTDNIRDFILSNPLQFEIRKVDQLWFIDVVSGGKIQEYKPDTALTTKTDDELDWAA